MRSNESFGHFSFFSGLPREINAKTLDYCFLLKINLKKFLEVLREFPDDYEKYCEIRDKIVFNKE